mmetsp:Transcript_23940/g.42403  ORF Transcript_23940/g.42403 Transcript_23940/m.42403 type:complete len:273 (+) Transcript_23940:248-1066(+)
MSDISDFASTTQVGGHTVILRTPEGHLLKPIEYSAEAEFYYSPPSSLLSCMPVCYALHPYTEQFTLKIVQFLSQCSKDQGCKADLFRKLAEHLPGRNYLHVLEMEDVTAGMSRPCVLDLKFCDLGETEEKREYVRKKYKGTTLLEFGFLYTGMQYFIDDVLNSHSKYDVYLLSVPQTRDLTRKFFNSEYSRSPALNLIVEKVRDVVRCLENTPDYRFFSSSLLVAYDASEPTRTVVKLIDFGRAGRVEGTGLDTESITSLANFIEFIDEIAS